MKHRVEMWGSKNLISGEDLENIAHSIIPMLEKGLFDDSVGLVEGFEIFRQLMEHGILIWILSNSIHVLICRTQER